MRSVKNVVIATLVAGTATSAATDAGAAATYFLRVTGAKQGPFKGDSAQKAHHNDIVALGFEYEVSSPRDPATGLASGKRQHSPIVITKALDSSSPQFYEALATNEVLRTAELDIFQTAPTGASVLAYAFKLTNAQVTDLRQYSAGTENVEALASGGDVIGPAAPLEQVSLTFERIEESSVSGQTTAIDDVATAGLQ